MNAPKQINNAPPFFFSKITDLRMTSLTNPSWVSSREELVNQSAAQRNNDLHDNVADFLFETRLWTCAAWSNFGSGNRIYRNWSMVLSLSAQKTAGGKKRKRKWQSCSQGWKPYNNPHCVSVGRLLFAIFLYKLWRKKKPSFCSFSFPPLTFPLDLQIHWLTSPPLPLQTLPPPLPSCPPLPPLVGRLRWAVAHYSTWQRRPPFSATLLSHKLQTSFISPPIFKWISLARTEEAHSPPSSPSLCVSVLSFPSESFIGTIQWQ